MTETQLTVLRDELAPNVLTAEGLRSHVGELAVLFDSTSARLDEIANRGFFGRMFSNTTRDLALAVSDVVKLQQYTVALVLAALELHAHNADMLDVLRDELGKVHGGLGTAASRDKEHAEGILTIRRTVGHMVAVVERQAAQARRVRDLRAELAADADATLRSARRVAWGGVVVGLTGVVLGGAALMQVWGLP